MAGPSWVRFYARVSAAFTVKVCLIAIAVVGGMKIDEKFHSKPWGILGCLVVALSIGMWWLLRTLDQLDGEK